VWAASWHPTGRLFATGGADRTICLWAVAADGTAALAWQSPAAEHSRTIRRMAWSPCGILLAVASFDASVSLWRLRGPAADGLELECVLEGHEHEAKGVAWDATGHFLATCSRDRSVWVWERPDAAPGADAEFECAGVLQGHTQDVKSVMFAPPVVAGGAPDLISCGYDDTVKVWRRGAEGEDWHCVQTLTQHRGTVWDCCLRPRAEGPPVFASASDDGTIRLWYYGPSADASAQEPRWRALNAIEGAHGSGNPVLSADWMPAQVGDALVSAGRDDMLSVTCVSPDGKYHTVARWPVPNALEVNCVRASPVPMTDGSVLVVTAADDGVALSALRFVE
jgi:WD40 repeat protein